jgi:ATPase subunit of ABC transporter with duplicated ATPase domains
MVQPLKNFSGGWRARVALAQGLFMEPDLLMLDEPTNHLDLNAVIWLQEMCAKWSKTLIIISHNTGFIQRAANSIWEIRNNQIYSYNCSYRKYLKQRDHDVKKKIKDWELLEKELAALKKKGTPASKKAAEDLLSKRTREGVSRPEKAYVPKFILMNKSTASTDAALLKTDNATLGYSSEKIILRNVTFALYPGSRIALVGENGSGKSTFLKFLTDELEYVAGCSVEKKKGLRVCKFDQHFYHSLPEQQTPIQYLSAFSEIDIVRKILGASGLEGSAHSRPIQTLSGGQKARVYFASLSIQSPDILLLDEPTNHLDIETISGLSQALLEFSGAAVIVSHDVEFLSELATEVWCVKHSQLVRLSEGSEGLEQYVEDIISSIDMN